MTWVRSKISNSQFVKLNQNFDFHHLYKWDYIQNTIFDVALHI